MKLKDCKRIKLPTTREEWLENRMKGIGGSDAGAIVGVNPWKSPYTLWCEKTGKITNDIDNEVMRQGRDLEQYVAERFCEETGKKVRRSGFSYQSKEHPFMLANVDRLVIGESAGLECKTTNMLNKTDYENGDVPPSYYAQCQHYMAVTGLKKWYIAVLALSKAFYWLEIERDEEYISNLIQYESDFWQSVKTNQPPEIDGSTSTKETLNLQYGKADEDSCVNLMGCEDAANILKDVKQKEKELKKLKTKYENEIKSVMGTGEKGLMDGYEFTWKNQIRNTLDSTKLKKERPDIYDQYLKTRELRIFKMKETR